MPVLKVKKNGVWEDIMGGGSSASMNGGNADTLDGKHADEFVSAEDITEIEGTLSSKYTKPSSGIPKSDLSSSVQTSLNKADSAIQSLSGYATESYVNTQVDTKVDKVNGKGLSTNDFTNEYKSKLDNMSSGITGTLQIENGGTGATTAAQACVNLGAASKNHNHSSNGISSLIKNYHNEGSGNSYSLILGAGGKGHLSPGMWLLTATTADKCSLRFFSNTGGSANQHELALSDINLPALIFVAEDSVERTVVIDVINGNVATAELSDDGTTYIISRSSLKKE